MCKYDCKCLIFADISVGHSQCIYNGILIEHEQEFHPDNLDSEDDQADNKTYLHCTECTCFVSLHAFSLFCADIFAILWTILIFLSFVL